jgi:hypothetical protein
MTKTGAGRSAQEEKLQVKKQQLKSFTEPERVNP